jgi:hypothetical protein
MPRLALILLVTVAGGCDGLTVAFSVPLDEQWVEGDPVGAGAGLRFTLPLDVAIDLEGEAATAANGPFQAVYLEALDFAVTNTGRARDDFDDLTFVDEAELFLRADGLEERRIAVSTETARGGQFLLFELDTTLDLKPYLEASPQLRGVATGRVPEDDVSFDGLLRLRLELL